MKYCSTCGLELHVPTSWSKHREAQRSLICKGCEAIRAREYNSKKRDRRRKWLNKYKVNKGCEVCGYNSHPAALHFDHITPDTKSFGIGSNILRPLKVLIQEVRKCRVLCANCHSVYTYEEKHHARNKKY